MTVRSSGKKKSGGNNRQRQMDANSGTDVSLFRRIANKLFPNDSEQISEGNKKRNPPFWLVRRQRVEVLLSIVIFRFNLFTVYPLLKS